MTWRGFAGGDREDSNQQNVAPVARVASETMAGVARILRQGQVPLVIGGDCSITIGVIASFARVDARPALLYVDGGPDLYPPDTRPNGNLDAMGMAHLLAIPGHVPEVGRHRAHRTAVDAGQDRVLWAHAARRRSRAGGALS